MANKYIFDMAYLRAIAEHRVNMKEIAKQLDICGDRLELLLLGEAEFRYSEMLAFARILNLTAEEFERCFFTFASSENLN